MEKYKFDDRNGLWYELQGDYYLPCLKLPEEEQAYIGIWGQRHLRYLKKHHRVLYGNLLTSGKLNGYLVDIDRQAEEMFERLVKQMAEREGVTEQLKAANSMEWVRKLNSMDKNEIALSVGVELSFLDESSQREVLEQCAINDCTPSYSQAWRMHKADREGALTTAVIQTIMSEEKANQRETVKVPISRLREVLPQGLDAKKTEDFIIKACDYYRKYLVRQRNRDER